ncbi:MULTISPECIES: SGNH/GDSL hydrolase family protein [Loigolactobacillus]|uniref:SGNH hydrolase-type esterase domain-containing protein n=1 Tax=Loigolactobacillus backii TaxID=375175 RepID=A0A192GYS1_9LACO|nr:MULTISPECIES: SGNH/GDSL hydrolase family protein [Loigolactobacillus]ANK60756.1 hypothetical protein AYR52_11140 [Loigolactobacillus backii]ANK61674.1 hypothetical protein AYR53_02180 [Loigolactobacillus backii]ANK65709.1 hypothetical protein AYR54_10940 [Loigolactobacillus backii]ANK68186.1 hypothetical protein AYR55_11095 [Loigolactobacillus backii]ANK69128.1 hypothetical protein AYR56_02530 [Loigolactobacillus backii]
MLNLIKTNANTAFPGCYFYGRWLSTGQENYTTNLGAGFFCHAVKPTKIDLYFIRQTTPQVVAWRVNNRPFHREVISDKPITLYLAAATNLQVVMSGNTDQANVWTNTAGFSLIAINSSEPLLAVKPGGPRFTFIGDSITAGCWVAGKTPAIDYRAETSYAALTAEYFGALDQRIAYSAAGICRPGQGHVPSALDFYNKINSTTMCPVPASDLIIINLGTNDWRLEQVQVKRAFAKLLDNLCHQFSRSRLVILISFSQRCAPTIRQVGRHYQVQIIETSAWNLTYTDQVHLDQNGSQMAAQCLVAALQHKFKFLQ